MHKSILLSLFIFSLVFSLPAKSDFVSCGSVKLLRVMIQASRDDGHPHANTLYIRMNNTCGNLGNNAAYIKNDHPAYNALTAIALSAKAQNKNVTVSVNSNSQIEGVYEIAIISDDN